MFIWNLDSQYLLCDPVNTESQEPMNSWEFSSETQDVYRYSLKSLWEKCIHLPILIFKI